MENIYFISINFHIGRNVRNYQTPSSVRQAERAEHSGVTPMGNNEYQEMSTYAYFAFMINNFMHVHNHSIKSIVCTRLNDKRSWISLMTLCFWDTQRRYSSKNGQLTQ